MLQIRFLLQFHHKFHINYVFVKKKIKLLDKSYMFFVQNLAIRGDSRASVSDCRHGNDDSRPVGGFWRYSGRITLVFQLSAKNKRGRSIMGWQSRRPSGFIAVPSVLWRFHGNLDCVSRPAAWSSSSLSSLLWSWPPSSTFNPWIRLSLSISLSLCYAASFPLVRRRGHEGYRNCNFIWG